MDTFSKILVQNEHRMFTQIYNRPEIAQFDDMRLPYQH